MVKSVSSVAASLQECEKVVMWDFRKPVGRSSLARSADFLASSCVDTRTNIDAICCDFHWKWIKVRAFFLVLYVSSTLTTSKPWKAELNTCSIKHTYNFLSIIGLEIRIRAHHFCALIAVNWLINAVLYSRKLRDHLIRDPQFFVAQVDYVMMYSCISQTIVRESRLELNWAHNALRAPSIS